MLQSLKLLNGLRYPNGLFSAAAKNVSTGYEKAWVRDNVYAALGLESVSPSVAVKTYHSLLDIFLKHEYKIDYAIKEKPAHAYQYIHARFHPQTLDEFWEHWGNKQNDSIGIFLFKVADLQKKGFSVIRGSDDIRIIQKLVDYLASIQYWNDADNGVWEEKEEVHASSVGACVAGLAALRGLDIFKIPAELIDNGIATLTSLLPNESCTKEVDLALLSLIYPLDIVGEPLRTKILQNVEEKLVRDRGVIRYVGDKYYCNGSEAEWCFGFPWLAVIYKKLGDNKKYHYYMYKTLSVMNARGEIPELYLGGTAAHNENSPLGWAQAMYLCALNENSSVPTFIPELESVELEAY